jgi:hypothetical protein
MKYQIGDRFEIEITDIDETGMGKMFYLNDCVGVTEKQLDRFDFKDTPFPEVANIKKVERPKEYTLDSLKVRIFRLSKLLANSIEAYENMSKGVEAVSNDIDNMVSAYETTDS